ncbi:MAG: alpha/beta hydrolase [Bacilli bacterium]|nr:alpha/beta hydrolase [Bacilli bacterium]
MIIRIMDTDINYIQYGKGSDVVLLHGWGQNIKMMDPIGKGLKSHCRVTIIDLPGFGDSSEPTYGWSVYDYCEMLRELILKLKLNNPTIIGHSFGGRIGLIYASKYDIKKLILFASPFRKMQTHLTIKQKILKFLKKVPVINKLESTAKKYIGSADYRNASITMREILVNTVNEDLTESVKNIKCSTLLIWGENDAEVLVSEAQLLSELINDSGLIVYPNCGHYAYLENINQTIKILNEFIK